MENQPVRLRLYKWAGQWGPFKVKIPCGECALTEDVIEDTLRHELINANVDFTVKEWLTYWWEPLFAGGGWHAPIVLVENKVIGQGDALNRGVLAEAVIREHVKRFALEGNHFFGKANCPYCDEARSLLAGAGVDYAYHDVVKNPGAMYEMLARVKAVDRRENASDDAANMARRRLHRRRRRSWREAGTRRPARPAPRQRRAFARQKNAQSRRAAPFDCD